MVTLEFTGNTQGAQIFRHPITKNQIRAGRNLAVRFINVDESEADYFVSLGLFRVAHQGVAVTTNVKRKEEPKRIVPIAEQEEPIAEKISEVEINLVSFEDDSPSIIDWMSDSTSELPTTDEIVESIKESAPEISSPDKTEKIKRGRPVKE